MPGAASGKPIASGTGNSGSANERGWNLIAMIPGAVTPAWSPRVYRFATIVSAPVRATAPLLLTHVAQNARDIPDRLRKRRHPAILFHAGGSGIVTAHCHGQTAPYFSHHLSPTPRSPPTHYFSSIHT